MISPFRLSLTLPRLALLAIDKTPFARSFFLYQTLYPDTHGSDRSDARPDRVRHRHRHSLHRIAQKPERNGEICDQNQKIRRLFHAKAFLKFG
jgi:hypothetical protein